MATKQPALDEMEQSGPPGQATGPQDGASPTPDLGNGSSPGAPASSGKGKGKTYMGVSQAGMDEMAKLRPTKRSAFPNLPTILIGMNAAAYSNELADRAGDSRISDQTMKETADYAQTIKNSKAGLASPQAGQSAPGMPVSPEDAAGPGGPMGGSPAGPPPMGAPPQGP